MAGVLDGVRVLDFGRYIAGPFCATLLGYLGAEVIRVEKLAGGEDRYVYPLSWREDGSEGEGSIFMQVGVNKKSMTLNPAKPEGREIVRKLVATADVVVANLPAPAMKSLGLDYDSLVQIKPDIILANISTFGPTGPYANRGGFDGIGQVMSGAAWFTGTLGNPVKSNAPWVDFGTALSTAFGTLAAIMHHRATGEGQEVGGALLRTGMMLMNGLLMEQAVLDINRQPSANRVQTSAPSDIFKTMDGHILTHTVGDALFARWARMMGEEEKWVNDPRFRSDQLRGDHGTVIGTRMAEWCAERTTDEAIAACEEFGVPAGPVLTPRQALEDPQVKAMGDLFPMQPPGTELTAPVAGPPFHLSKTPGLMATPAPALGAHTDEIMAELGYSADEIAELRAKRIV
ncbi:MAG: CoA transferase [Alphaproteobacteria bacterium]|nr:CoA transferase [Alphaproteobacteria bacterium]